MLTAVILILVPREVLGVVDCAVTGSTPGATELLLSRRDPDLRNYEAVVIAQVRDVRPRDDGYQDIVADITHTLIGSIAGTIEFFAPPRLSGGLRLGVGRTYLVLLVRENGDLRIAQCGPSQEVRSQQRLEYLLGFQNPVRTTNPSPAVLGAIAAAALLPFIVALVVLRARRGR
jgi:hypothetical protein